MTNGTVRVLVTGGRGAVGARLVQELDRRGRDVWLLDRGHSHEAQYLRADVGEYRQLERVVQESRPEYVYHLAAEFGRWNGEDFYETLWKTNVIGNKHLIRLQEKHRFRVIFFSSSEVYGDWDGVMREDVMDQHEVRQLNDYAMTKWIGELQYLNAQTMAGTETVRVRLFNTYGPGEFYSAYRSALCIFMYRALHRAPFTVYRGHTRTSSYVDDTVRTLANIMDNFIPGEVYNIAGTEEHTMEDAARIILERTGVPESLVTYRGPEPFTTRFKKVDVAKSIRDLRHAPQISLERGIPLTIDWMRQAYGL